MNKVEVIFKRHGGSREYIVRVGDINFIIPERRESHVVPANDSTYGSAEQISAYLPFFDKEFVFTLGDEIHDNKLEVLKSELEYEYSNSR